MQIHNPYDYDSRKLICDFIFDGNSNICLIGRNFRIFEADMCMTLIIGSRSKVNMRFEGPFMTYHLFAIQTFTCVIVCAIIMHELPKYCRLEYLTFNQNAMIMTFKQNVVRGKQGHGINYSRWRHYVKPIRDTT